MDFFSFLPHQALEVYTASNINQYQKQKNNVSGVQSAAGT
jgi:hypothetical protein